jgi:hypothetical protein
LASIAAESAEALAGLLGLKPCGTGVQKPTPASWRRSHTVCCLAPERRLSKSKKGLKGLLSYLPGVLGFLLALLATVGLSRLIEMVRGLRKTR